MLYYFKLYEHQQCTNFKFEESSLCPDEISLCPEDDLSNFEGEVSKEEVFQFYKLPWPVVSSNLLTLSQGRPVMIRRLQELDFSVSPSQPDTPKDGNCMINSGPVEV